jgi:hypothetical protein
MELLGNVGIELEMSDVLTSKAAEVVYGSSEQLPDYPFGYDKPVLDYSTWNLVPDSTIRNTDGTHCMKTYLEDGEIVKAKNGKNSPDRFKWKGAELISPVFNVDVSEEVLLRFNELSVYISSLQEQGANFDWKLQNALHVHVDICNLEPEEVRKLVTFIYFAQELVYPLGTNWSGSRKFTEEEMERLWAAPTDRDFWMEYCSPNGKLTEANRVSVRRFIDIGNYFSNIKDYQTVEFRCFKTSSNPLYILNCIYFAVWFVQSSINSDVFEDILPELEEWVSVLEEFNQQGEYNA